MTKNITLTEKVSKELEKILINAVDDENNKLFSNVIPGFPESISTFGEPIAILYVKGTGNYWNSQGRYNVPKNVKSVIGIIINGTGSATYKKAVKINDFLLNKFMLDKDWQKINNTVRMTFIEDNEIYIENKNGLRTTIIFALNHEVYK